METGEVYMHTTVNSGTRVCPTKPYIPPAISLSYPEMIEHEYNKNRQI